MPETVPLRSAVARTEPMSIAFTYNEEVHGCDAMVSALFGTEAEARGFRIYGLCGWLSDAGRHVLRSQVEGVRLCSYEDSQESIDVLEFPDVILSVSVTDGRVFVRFAASERDGATEIIDRLKELFPTPQTEDARTVPVFFWFKGANGPTSMRRWLGVNPWEEVAANYAAGTRGQLQDLVNLPEERRRNGLILWHGKPGTGKTHALRGLAWAWRHWASIHYVVDPDTFLGSSPDYLFHVMSELAGDDAKNRWSILVLEDTGELLAADAKARVGQALSRLLNLSDGLLGRATKLITIVTTNEPVGSIHPAVARPGRCLSEVEFDIFSQKEARKWLKDRGAAELKLRVGPEGCSLAELYALADGTIERPEQIAVGGSLYL